MSTIRLGPGVVSIAPPGTDPNDVASWQVLGTATGADLILDEPDPPPMVWPLTSRTITFTSRTRLTWCGYRTLLRRTSPHARRVKTAYHRRRR